MTGTFRRIAIRDNPETVNRKIRQASAPMFVREFTQNAIEAARAAGPAARIKWWQFTGGPTRKLCVWNNGRGMDAFELTNVMDLFSSGGDKSQAADENYGIGAKITGLKASPHGVLWRSCKNGIVHQLYLGWQDNVPGFDEPEDVTELYAGVRLKDFDLELFKQFGKADCGLVDFEWTMAVFFGHEDGQDTVVDPLGDGKPIGGRSYWLPKQINRRYYDLGMYHVTAICDRGEHEPQSRVCHGLYHLEVEREETQEMPYGIIRYCLLPVGQSKSNEEAKGYGGHGGLVFRNEIYDGLFDGPWGIHGRRFGVIAGADRVSIQVVLNNDYPATPNEQRNLLERELGRGERLPIYLHDFEDDVCAYMPAFLRDFISEEDAKKQGGSEKSRKAIKKLMAAMGLTAKTPSEEDTEPIATESGDGDADIVPPRVGRTDGPGPSPGPSPTLPRVRPPRPPYKRGRPVQTGVEKNLTSEPHFEWEPDRGEKSTTVGVYDAATHTIILYESYPVLEKVVDSVLASGVPDVYRERVREEAKTQIEIAAARHVLWALAQVSTRDWNISQQEAAVTPEALTASLGFYDAHHAAVEVQCRQFKHRK